MIRHQIVYFHGSSDFVEIFVLLFARFFLFYTLHISCHEALWAPWALKKVCVHRIPVRKKNNSSPGKLILPVTNAAVIEWWWEYFHIDKFNWDSLMWENDNTLWVIHFAVIECASRCYCNLLQDFVTHSKLCRSAAAVPPGSHAESQTFGRTTLRPLDSCWVIAAIKGLFLSLFPSGFQLKVYQSTDCTL